MFVSQHSLCQRHPLPFPLYILYNLLPHRPNRVKHLPVAQTTVSHSNTTSCEKLTCSTTQTALSSWEATQSSHTSLGRRVHLRRCEMNHSRSAPLLSSLHVVSAFSQRYHLLLSYPVVQRLNASKKKVPQQSTTPTSLLPCFLYDDKMPLPALLPYLSHRLLPHLEQLEYTLPPIIPPRLFRQLLIIKSQPNESNSLTFNRITPHVKLASGSCGLYFLYTKIGTSPSKA